MLIVIRVKWLVVACFVITCSACQSMRPPAQVLPASPETTEIKWRQWNEKTFRVAQEEDKLILLDLTAVWCHACHVMEETTYADSLIASTINTRFIPIRVDTDERPDIDARYRHGGWPTTSILLPTGEIVFQGNFLETDELRQALHDSEQVYRTNKEALLSQAAKIWEAVEVAKKARLRSRGGIKYESVDQMATMIAQNFDAVNGGFREAPKFFEPEAIAFLFNYDEGQQDSSWTQMALMTLEHQRSLIDPVWGGFYRYAENADWTNPHFEKMLHLQALNLKNYLEAYQVTGKEIYRVIVEETMEYVTQFLLDEEDRGFFANQDADLKEGVGSHRILMSGEDYFRLGAKEREKIGIPHVDRTVYTGWNGTMIHSWLKVYQVLGESNILKRALNILDDLYRRRYVPGQGMAHRQKGGEPETPGLLSDQVAFAEALLEASFTTGNAVYREKAERLTNDFISQLEDHQGGGLYDRPVDASSEGLLKFPHKSLSENLRAAILLSDLFYVTENTVYRDAAERTLQYVLGSAQTLPLGLTGLACMRFLEPPVHVVVVGEAGNEKTTQLFREGLRLYAPGKVIRLLDPQKNALSIGKITFPAMREPRAYVCTESLCSEPISRPGDVEARYKELVKLAK